MALCSEVAKTDAEKESEARCTAMLRQLISAVKKQTSEMEDLAVSIDELAVGLKAIVQPLGAPVQALPPPVPAPTATRAAAEDHVVAAATPWVDAILTPESPTRCSTNCSDDSTNSQTSAFLPDAAPGSPSTVALLDAAIPDPNVVDAKVLDSVLDSEVAGSSVAATTVLHGQPQCSPLVMSDPSDIAVHGSIGWNCPGVLPVVNECFSDMQNFDWAGTSDTSAWVYHGAESQTEPAATYPSDNSFMGTPSFSNMSRDWEFKSLLDDEAVTVGGTYPSPAPKDSTDSIAAGNYPEWQLYIQTIDPDHRDRFGLDSLDVAKTWTEDIIPLQPVGQLVLNKNIDNCFAGDEQFASTMGLLLTYTLNITNLLTAVLRLASLAENSLNTVERVGTYIELPSEAPPVIEDNRPPPGWPSSGVIKFEDVVLRYRPELPPVLHAISFIINESEKVGIVGRTGAGKSSMLNALFRIVELERGRMLIDDCDTSKFGIWDLRKVLGIIPQAPVLFSGSVRFNLDPFNEHNDADLWEALERAHLKHVIRRNALGLDAEVSEAGENFSVGQRQLLSLARALLRRAKILVLDEATAAVDVRTDALIQKTIREEFKSCTMLIIAHRLNTVIDCDRLLILSAGQVLEFDTPENLLSNEQSAFSKMVQSTGPSNAEYLKSLVFGDGEKRLQKEESKMQDAIYSEEMGCI